MSDNLRLLKITLGILSLLGACTTGSHSDKPPLQVVQQVDLDRYLGTWYEIASIPNTFQRGCVATKATYSRLENGTIQVINECRQGTLDGKPRRIVGTAWVAGADPAKLKVQFFRPFRGDYWIIELDKDYGYAVVGHPTREYLWILSRTPSMDPELYQELLRRIAAHGYDPTEIQRTLQPVEVEG
ncbi:MAG: lipocalin family protein [Candidatus Competibacteraceae bacterium]